MYAHELFEAGKPNIVVTYPGRFQPFHQGHAAVFAKLQKQYGSENVYILTSNDAGGPKSPFNFSDKYQLITAAGIPGDRIIETNSMYALPEQFDFASTVFITAVGSPDAQRLSPDGFLKRDNAKTGKKKGDPGYFKTWKGPEHAVTSDQHGYVVIIPEVKKSIKIKGKPYDVSHGTECRNLWNQVRDDAEARNEFLVGLYGRATPELVHIFNKIPQTTAEDVMPDLAEDAAGVGVVAGKKQARDPRYSMSLTKDVRPGAVDKSLRAFRLKEASPEDFEIHNLEKLDTILTDLCEMVIEGQEANTDYGMVAACVLDPNNIIVSKLNSPGEDGKRIHAEHVAMSAYVAEHGPIPEGSIIITTLSPCCEDMAEREGVSCTDLINDSNVNKVYCGYMDPTQTENNRTFTLQESNNPSIRNICKRFADTFLELDEDVAGQFNSKQEAIAYFVSKGKSAAQGAAAWERGWRGPKPRVKKHQPDPNTRYWWQDMDESAVSDNPDLPRLIANLLPIAMQVLGIDSIPKIELEKNIEISGGQATFGRFDPDEGIVYLAIANRHPIDILRTLAHELTHYKQSIRDELNPVSGETGSPEENEAHVKAGIIMRLFNKKYPDTINLEPVEI